MSNKDASLGYMRFLADKRQYAGLLMVTGFCALIQPLAGIGATVNSSPEGTTVTYGLPFSTLLGMVAVAFTGFMAISVGYLELVHDWGNKYLTAFAIVTGQFAYIAYFSFQIGIGRVARTGGSFIGYSADSYDQTSTDNQFIAAMGILGVMAYGFTLVGAIAFMEFSLYTSQVGKPEERNGKYYKGRLWFYSLNLTLAGLSQFLLGCYTLSRFGTNLRGEGPVVVAMYFVVYPPMTLIVGWFQLMNGVWGFLRSHGVLVFGPNDRSFYYSLAVMWVIQLLFQDMIQSFIMGPVAQGFAPSITAFSFSMNAMSAFLDHKAQTTPETIDPSYYSVVPNDEGELEVVSEDQKAKESAV